MITYANVFGLRGDGAREAILKAVGAWTKKKLGVGIHPNNLTRSWFKRGEFPARDGSGMLPATLKIAAALLDGVETVSWSLRHPDELDSRRTWITEVGMRVSESLAEFSCVNRCDDVVPFPEAIPTATQPGVVNLVLKNVKSNPDVRFDADAVGLAPKFISSDADSILAFEVEIERTERRYPLVLISQPEEAFGRYDLDFIQSRLFGLAQVVGIRTLEDSFQLRRMLGDRFSAWGGSINIISPTNRAGKIWSRFAVLDEVLSWGPGDAEIAQELLTRIASGSNLSTLRLTIRPEQVLQDALKAAIQGPTDAGNTISADQLEQLRISAEAAAVEAKEWTTELENENSQLSEDIRELKAALHEKDALNRRLTAQLDNLQSGIEYQKNNKGIDRGSDILRKWITTTIQGFDPSPSDVLEIIEVAFGDRVVILSSAWASAQEASDFKYGSRLLSLMIRLATEWVDRLEAGGDSQARAVFGKDQYAAQESETVKNSPRLSKMRTFSFDGRDIPMFSHLKIGVADNSVETIRVHFHWDGVRKKLLIGHCGPHLPLK